MTTLDLSPMTMLAGLLIGFIAGAVGGLAGVGGSIIMLPGLALVFGYATEAKSEQHLYMAAAMTVNVVVAYFSARRHAKEGAVDKVLVRWMLPLMALGMVAGVLLSNRFDGAIMKLGLVVFLFGYSLINIVSVFRASPEPPPETENYRHGAASGIAGTTGVLSGFLGIGGGIVLVPALQLLARVPLRRAIGASSAVMWATALVGSILKLATLGEHQLSWVLALALAAPMALGAVFGAPLGAGLTHKLPIKQLRVALSVVLALAGARMIGLI